MTDPTDRQLLDAVIARTQLGNEFLMELEQALAAAGIGVDTVSIFDFDDDDDDD
jgi:hypothetical protein